MLGVLPSGAPQQVLRCYKIWTSSHAPWLFTLCVSPGAVPWLSRGISDRWGQLCSITITTLIQQLQHGPTKPVRTQFFQVTAHCCFQSPPQIATESAINELGFQKGLTSVFACSSSHHTVTPHSSLDTEALAEPAISGQGFIYHQRSVCFCHYRIPSVYVSSLSLCHSEQSPFLVNL